jgi:hypothetical protein
MARPPPTHHLSLPQYSFPFDNPRRLWLIPRVMQRLIVDMDGVLADACAQFIAYDERDTRRRKTLAEILGKPELEIFERANEYVRMPGFFREAPLIAGSREVLEQLNRRYELFIVSAATEYETGLSLPAAESNAFRIQSDLLGSVLICFFQRVRACFLAGWHEIAACGYKTPILIVCVTFISELCGAHSMVAQIYAPTKRNPVMNFKNIVIIYPSININRNVFEKNAPINIDWGSHNRDFRADTWKEQQGGHTRIDRFKLNLVSINGIIAPDENVERWCFPDICKRKVSQKIIGSCIGTGNYLFRNNPCPVIKIPSFQHFIQLSLHNGSLVCHGLQLALRDIDSVFCGISGLDHYSILLIDQTPNDEAANDAKNLDSFLPPIYAQSLITVGFFLIYIAYLKINEVFRTGIPSKPWVAWAF